jgi:hypothetical protein
MAIFILFSELPTELRLQIWEAALPAPRNHMCQVWECPTSHFSHFNCYRKHSDNDPCIREEHLICALLITCRESRDLALKKHFTEWIGIIDYLSDKDILRLHVDELSFLREHGKLQWWMRPDGIQRTAARWFGFLDGWQEDNRTGLIGRGGAKRICTDCWCL